MGPSGGHNHDFFALNPFHDATWILAQLPLSKKQQCEP